MSVVLDLFSNDLVFVSREIGDNMGTVKCHNQRLNFLGFLCFMFYSTTTSDDKCVFESQQQVASQVNIMILCR